MLRFATGIGSFVITLISLVIVSSAHADDEATKSRNNSKPPAVAKSHDELAKLVFASLDTEDYTTIQQLMAPPKLLKEMGAPERARAIYAEYLAGLPKLAKAYRGYLDQEKLLPLKGRAFAEYTDNDGLSKEVNGKRIQYCTGIRVIENPGKDNERVIEIVDQAFGYDGRWYIGHLATESVEKKLKLPEDKDSPAEKQ